jgi:predicted ATPase
MFAKYSLIQKQRHKKHIKAVFGKHGLNNKKTFFFFGEIGHAKHSLMSRKGAS